MTVLSDGMIEQELDEGELEITPLDREAQVQPSSVDLCLGREVIPESTGLREIHHDEITFEQGQSYLAQTQEVVSLPAYLAGDVKGRSSIARMFLQVHCAGWVDAGFEGQLTLEITNLGDNPRTLEVGDRVCQMVFHPLNEPANEPYGVKRDSKYQGQTGATPSRFEGFSN